MKISYTLILCILALPAFAQDPLVAFFTDVGKNSKSVKVDKNLVYATYGDRELKLDLYQPKAKADAPRPIVVMIHGGAWKMGNKQTCMRQSYALAAKGYVVACIAYRLVPEVTIRECVYDAKAAVRFVRSNAEKWNANPDRIGAMGGSAGGHLVAMLATSTDTREMEGSGGHADVSSAIQAVVPMAAPADMANRWTMKNFKLSPSEAKKLSPIRYVDAKDPPCLLLHCREDKLVPYLSSQSLLGAYKLAGADATLVEIKKGGHAFWHNKDGIQETLAAVIPFFDRHLKRP